MYRQYEDPYKVQRLLYEAQTALENAMTYDPENDDLIISLHEEVEELEARLRFAWDDVISELEEQ